jgi:hypothetical protein
VSIDAGRNGDGTSHGGLMMPDAASWSHSVAEEMAAMSFSAANFVAPVAARSGCDLLPCPSSSTADQHVASVPSSRSHSMSLTAGETSCEVSGFMDT